MALVTRLDLYSAILVVRPKVVLNKSNLQDVLRQRLDESKTPENEANWTFATFDIGALEDSINSLVERRVDEQKFVDRVTCGVLTEAGFDYQMQPDNRRPLLVWYLTMLRNPRASQIWYSRNAPRPFGRMRQVPTYGRRLIRPRLEPARLEPAGESTSGRSASMSTLESSPVLPARKSGRGPPRKGPNEPLDPSSRVTCHERFCHNIARWLEARMNGSSKNHNYTFYERMAAGIMTRIDWQHAPVSRAELEDLKSSEGKIKLAEDEYRTLRARILIGMACVYEHNRRGMALNRRHRLHLPCRPSPEAKFKPINMGISQAQMFSHGFDVKKATAVHNACVSADLLPGRTQLNESKAHAFLDSNADEEGMERYLPATQCRALYSDLIAWYNEIVTHQELRFIIEDDDDATDTDLDDLDADVHEDGDQDVRKSRWDLLPPRRGL